MTKLKHVKMFESFGTSTDVANDPSRSWSIEAQGWHDDCGEFASINDETGEVEFNNGDQLSPGFRVIATEDIPWSDLYLDTKSSQTFVLDTPPAKVKRTLDDDEPVTAMEKWNSYSPMIQSKLQDLGYTPQSWLDLGFEGQAKIWNTLVK